VRDAQALADEGVVVDDHPHRVGAAGGAHSHSVVGTTE
jgi:hypothetical protein